jgi:hypothetical protein
LSRCNSKLRIISSKDVPVGAPEGLNRQPHTEQPKPRKRGCSIHTNSRLMAASVAAPQRVPACCQGTKRSGSPLTAPFAAAYCLIAAENRHPVWAWRKMHKKMHKRMGEVYMRQFGWSVGRPTNMEEFCSCERLIWGASFEVSGIALSVGHVWCVAMLARSSGEANVGYSTERHIWGKQWTLYNFASSANKKSFCFPHHGG